MTAHGHDQRGKKTLPKKAATRARTRAKGRQGRVSRQKASSKARFKR